jgi:hypothetical protein
VKLKVKQAVLKILSLQNEFTKGELNEAFNFIRESRIDTIFDKFGPSQKSGSVRDAGVRKSSAKPAGNERLIDLSSFQVDDPEKLEILSMFVEGLQSGKYLSSLDSIRKFGLSLEKDFYAGKSRKDAVPKIVELVAKMPVDDVRKFVRRVIDTKEDAGMLDKGYQNLAEFLLRN